jgi:glutamate synthase domain-containing protein 2
MELTTYLGQKPDKVEFEPGSHALKTELPPQVKLDVPVMFSAMSYGAVSLNVHESMARAANEMGTLWNTGEGGLHPKLYKYGDNTIVQVASGRFGVHSEYLDAARVVEIKIGQGAKPGIGGHLPGEKVGAEVSSTRMIPKGTDALSPAPQHDIYSIEDLAQLVYALKEATDYIKPVAVKIAAVHNSAAIASGMVRAGADIIVLDGLRGSTGAAPKIIRDNVGIPIELALASVDDRLRREGIRNQASVVIAGGIRSSGDVAKAIALGADAVYIGTAALIALGCTTCQQCHTGKCAWGICTTDRRLMKRVNPDIGARRLSNLLRAWSLELKDILGGMGINALESLRGNRLQLRGVGLTDTELDILGIRMAGG